MDGRALLQYAAQKLSPNDANKVVEESDLVFLVGSQWVKFHEGGMYAENGTPVSTGMSGVTDVAHLDTVRSAADRRRANGEDPDKEPERVSDEQLRAAGVQNMQRNTSVTIPNDAVKESGSGPFVRNGTQHIPDGPVLAREPLVVEVDNQGGTPLRPTDERGLSNPTTAHPSQQLSPEAQELLNKSRQGDQGGQGGQGDQEQSTGIKPGLSKPGTAGPAQAGSGPAPVKK
jgi:hypothetical protein